MGCEASEGFQDRFLPSEVPSQVQVKLLWCVHSYLLTKKDTDEP
jgi:hypothetical protein